MNVWIKMILFDKSKYALDYRIFSPFFSDKKGGKGKDPRNDTSDEEDSPQSGKIEKPSSFFAFYQGGKFNFALNRGMIPPIQFKKI